MQWKLCNDETGEERLFKEGDDVAEFLGIVKYEPAGSSSPNPNPASHANAKYSAMRTNKNMVISP